MGAEQPQQKKVTLEDTLMEMKMASKKMARESAKAMKESEAYMKKAKEALKKNNEEGAKLYLQTAASKRTESMSIQRMGLKMEFLAGNMKNMESNKQIMGSFQMMGQVINGTGNINFATMSADMQKFERAMDQITINGKMMEEIMNVNGAVTDGTADNMLEVLKGELAMDAINEVDQAALIQQQEKEYQQKLKGL